MDSIIKTSIEGLVIRLNKVVMDERGFLVELAPLGAKEPFFKSGIRNIHASTATAKHVARAGHLHHKNIENFYTLSGTALWLFVDCRKKSSSFNKFTTVILGAKAEDVKSQDPVYTISQSKMAQVFVPNGVYHVFWPLTDEPVIVLDIASEPYIESDYGTIDLKTVPGVKEKLSEYGIVME